ncbi:hypothetical protein CIPAW_07G229200 [Carya illinoinensis]|uniref:Uncharacterized protein n=1 Tax=Carya illinoinensis TaxID=32201 RepID=A0A8T1Q5R4_CARIL|nr:hypothetical protein CIPAW_07G229200 [Carya illinoinensis]KAG6649694.1 hypothetical protein CIPAW_07G229200 [Carya illinoinensis]
MRILQKKPCCFFEVLQAGEDILRIRQLKCHQDRNLSPKKTRQTGSVPVLRNKIIIKYGCNGMHIYIYIYICNERQIPG